MKVGRIGSSILSKIKEGARRRGRRRKKWDKKA
jgi:hypothetical protein